MEGLSNLWVDLIVPIADFFRLVFFDKLTSDKFIFFADLVKLYYSVQEVFSSLDDISSGTTFFGFLYDVGTFGKSALNLISSISDIVNSITEGFKLEELSKLLKFVVDLLPNNDQISEAKMLIDGFQLFTGYFYIIQL